MQLIISRILTVILLGCFIQVSESSAADVDIYDDEYVFNLESVGKHQTMLRFSHTSSGWFAKGLHNKLGEDTGKAVREMLRALKKVSGKKESKHESCCNV